MYRSIHPFDQISEVSGSRDTRGIAHLGTLSDPYLGPHLALHLVFLLEDGHGMQYTLRPYSLPIEGNA